MSTILVFDDDMIIIKLLRRLLEREGHTVLSACDGHTAIELLTKVPEVCLVISDIRVPGQIDGIGLYSWVEQKAPHLIDRFVFLSATEGDLGKAKLTHVPTLTKPASANEIMTAVNQRLAAQIP